MSPACGILATLEFEVQAQAVAEVGTKLLVVSDAGKTSPDLGDIEIYMAMRSSTIPSRGYIDRLRVR
jgi:hypothetical protein